jgi:hypothetical protein
MSSELRRRSSSFKGEERRRSSEATRQRRSSETSGYLPAGGGSDAALAPAPRGSAGADAASDADGLIRDRYQAFMCTQILLSNSVRQLLLLQRTQVPERGCDGSVNGASGQRPRAQRRPGAAQRLRWRPFRRAAACWRRRGARSGAWAAMPVPVPNQK